GIGWAAGIERLAMLLEGAPRAPRPIALIPLGAAAERQALVLAHRLRRSGFVIDLGYSGNMKRRKARANRADACAALILGDDELARGVLALRDMDAGTQADVPFDDLEAVLAERLAGGR